MPGVNRHRLRQARKAAGLSQNDAAKATGLTVATIQNWETGRRTQISAADLARAALAYRHSTDWMLDLSDDPSLVLPGEGGGAPLKSGLWGPAGRSPKRDHGEAEESG